MHLSMDRSYTLRTCLLAVGFVLVAHSIATLYGNWHRQHLRTDGVLFYDPVLLQTPNIR